MKNLYASIRHNSGIVLSATLIPFALIYAYSCQSVVVSTIPGRGKITRPELIAEVDLFLSVAEAKFADLDRQDLVKSTIFNSLTELASGQTVNPVGLLLVIGNLLGLGAVVDNVRKRTHINTLKGDTLNGKIKEEVEKVVHRPSP